MAATTNNRWGKVLADSTERFNEICSILSDTGSAMQVTHNKSGFTLGMGGNVMATQLTEKELDGVINAMWLLAESSQSTRKIVASYVLNQ